MVSYKVRDNMLMPLFRIPPKTSVKIIKFFHFI